MSSTRPATSSRPVAGVGRQQAAGRDHPQDADGSLALPRGQRLDEADAVIAFLNDHGPSVGLPTLRAEFPDLARAELQDLLGCYRHLWLAEHPRELCELHWHVPGSVWAMDFTEVRQWIDGRCRYVFAVRDLASGM